MLVRLAPGTSIAGAFTRSSTRAACILDCQAKLKGAQDNASGAAIIVNSGNANAFTGAPGEQAVDAVTAAVAGALDVPSPRVFSTSTGVIGEPLPADRIVAVIDDLARPAGRGGIADAARAIMTTDTFPKGAGAQIEGDGGTIQHRRHRQGVGHDRARHGDDAGLYLHRRDDPAQAAAADAVATAWTTPSTRSPWTATPRPSDALILAATGTVRRPADPRHALRAGARLRRPRCAA